MKQSDAAWFSGPALHSQLADPRSRSACAGEALIQRLAFHRPLSSHAGSAVSRGLGLFTELHYFTQGWPLPRKPAGAAGAGSTLRLPATVAWWSPLPSSSSPSPNLFTSPSSPPAFFPLALPLLNLCNMWKLLGGRWGAECLRWILISVLERREASPLYRNTVKVSLQILKGLSDLPNIVFAPRRGWKQLVVSLIILSHACTQHTNTWLQRIIPSGQSSELPACADPQTTEE